jgi:putative CocE/NonD family hydrolase
LAAPSEIYRVTVDAGVTANVFLKGHRIRLEISSSNFPRFDRNANTGGAVEQAAKLVKASQTVYHDGGHPSCLVLMVVPGKG